METHQPLVTAGGKEDPPCLPGVNVNHGQKREDRDREFCDSKAMEHVCFYLVLIDFLE